MPVIGVGWDCRGDFSRPRASINGMSVIDAWWATEVAPTGGVCRPRALINGMPVIGAGWDCRGDFSRPRASINGMSVIDA